MTRYVQIRIQVISTDVDTAENNPLTKEFDTELKGI